MAAADQAARKAALAEDGRNIDLNKKILELDKEHTEEVTKILDEHGWPPFTLIGKRASNSFWLLVQHADHRPDVQRRALKLLRRAVANQQAHRRNLAYLEDRVLVRQNKPQQYGTQFRKGWHPFPTKDPEGLNKRRRKMGLEPVEQ